jgi:hypothetical protein
MCVISVFKIKYRRSYAFSGHIINISRRDHRRLCISSFPTVDATRIDIPTGSVPCAYLVSGGHRQCHAGYMVQGVPDRLTDTRLFDCRLWVGCLSNPIHMAFYCSPYITVAGRVVQAQVVCEQLRHGQQTYARRG